MIAECKLHLLLSFGVVGWKPPVRVYVRQWGGYLRLRNLDLVWYASRY